MFEPRSSCVQTFQISSFPSFFNLPFSVALYNRTWIFLQASKKRKILVSPNLGTWDLSQPKFLWTAELEKWFEQLSVSSSLLYLHISCIILDATGRCQLITHNGGARVTGLNPLINGWKKSVLMRSSLSITYNLVIYVFIFLNPDMIIFK